MKAVIIKKMTDSGERLSYFCLKTEEAPGKFDVNELAVTGDGDALAISKVEVVDDHVHLYFNEEKHDLHTFRFNVEKFLNEFCPMDFEIVYRGVKADVEVQDLPWVADFADETFTPEESEALKYRLYDSGSKEKRPLVIFIHGTGERGVDNLLPMMANDCVPTIYEYAKEVEDALILVPQAPWDLQIGAWSFPQIRVSLENLVKEIIAEYPVDQKRVYVSGLSNGASATWNLLKYMPEYFAAGVPICGYMPAENPLPRDLSKAPFYGAPVAEDVAKIKDIPVWVFHAEDDPLVAAKAAKELVDALQEAGNPDARYTEYPAGEVTPNPHASWEPAYNDGELLPWLFSKRK
ncbi:MAG: hypothetical protein FWE07_07960 [Turicibacter sp.]|nr:hypothetical protein [Turicibacter sp.]